MDTSSRALPRRTPRTRRRVIQPAPAVGLVGFVGAACLLVAPLGPAPGQQPDTGQEPAEGEVRARLEGLERGLDEAYDQATDRQSDLFASNYAMARFKARQTRAYLDAGGGLYLVAGDADQALADGFAALEALQAGKPWGEARTGHLERAYISRNDETAQPYYVYVPETYDPARSWPLIVFLHGYVTDTSIIRPWVLPEEQEAIATQCGALLVTPYGRRNTDFQGVGEVDVLRALEEMQRYYRIDPERIYIAGPSMGGYGAWDIALRYPGLFAAAAPGPSRIDMFEWWRDVYGAPWPPREQTIAFKRFLVEWDNPIDLLPNAIGQAFYVQHGDGDRLEPVAHSRRITEALRNMGVPVTYEEWPHAGHYIYWEDRFFTNSFGWLVEQRLDPRPTHVHLKSYSCRYDTAFWVGVLEYERWATPGEVDAQVDTDRNAINLTTSNVARLSLDVARLMPGVLKPDADLVVSANGQECFRGRHTEAEPLAISLRAGGQTGAPAGLHKQRGLCGPLEDVFSGPFRVVYGCKGSEEQTAALKALAQRWCSDWDVYADGLPAHYPETAVSEDVLAQYSIVLFGDPQTSELLARVADRLPVRILGEHAFEVGGQRYEGERLGLALCHPNPLAPERYLLVYTGEPMSRHCGINHMFDLAPDYMIFTGEYNYLHDDTDAYLCAGWFDPNWQFDATLCYTQALDQIRGDPLVGQTPERSVRPAQ